MNTTGRVNYHVHAPHRQAFRIDPNGEAGVLVAPELEAATIDIEDARTSANAPSFARDGVEFAERSTHVAVGESAGWEDDYAGELDAMLREWLGAREVVVFDHTLRVDDPQATRRPARNVHGDYSEAGARARLVDLLGEDTAAEWERGHYAFVNVWRPLVAPVNSAPLAFVRPSSVSSEDWIPIDLDYPDRTGHIMGLAANPAHEWFYLSRMRPDEVVAFATFDNTGRPWAPHSAVDLVEDPTLDAVRRSVESRVVVRF